MKTNNTVDVRINKARVELDRYHSLGINVLNANRALQECYRQIAMAAVDASTPEDRLTVDIFLSEVEKKVGY